MAEEDLNAQKLSVIKKIVKDELVLRTLTMMGDKSVTRIRDFTEKGGWYVDYYKEQGRCSKLKTSLKTINKDISNPGLKVSKNDILIALGADTSFLNDPQTKKHKQDIQEWISNNGGSPVGLAYTRLYENFLYLATSYGLSIDEAFTAIGIQRETKREVLAKELAKYTSSEGGIKDAPEELMTQLASKRTRLGIQKTLETLPSKDFLYLDNAHQIEINGLEERINQTVKKLIKAFGQPEAGKPIVLRYQDLADAKLYGEAFYSRNIEGGAETSTETFNRLFGKFGFRYDSRSKKKSKKVHAYKRPYRRLKNDMDTHTAPLVEAKDDNTSKDASPEPTKSVKTRKPRPIIKTRFFEGVSDERLLELLEETSLLSTKGKVFDGTFKMDIITYHLAGMKRPQIMKTLGAHLKRPEQNFNVWEKNILNRLHQYESNKDFYRNNNMEDFVGLNPHNEKRPQDRVHNKNDELGYSAAMKEILPHAMSQLTKQEHLVFECVAIRKMTHAATAQEYQQEFGVLLTRERIRVILIEAMAVLKDSRLNLSRQSIGKPEEVPRKKNPANNKIAQRGG